MRDGRGFFFLSLLNAFVLLRSWRDFPLSFNNLKKYYMIIRKRGGSGGDNVGEK